MKPEIQILAAKGGRVYLCAPLGFMLAGLSHEPDVLRHGRECESIEKSQRIYAAGLVPCSLESKCPRCVGYVAPNPGINPKPKRTVRIEAAIEEVYYPTPPLSEYRPVTSYERRGSTSKTWHLAVMRRRKLEKMKP
jgi:hypothetical protein